MVEAVRVRYQEARHVGEALTREAVRTLATTVDVPPSSTIVVNSAARDRSGVVSVPLPGTGPVHLVALDDGTACPTQVVHTTTTDEGISTVVVGQKIRWVLEMMRGPELAGARIARVEPRTLTSLPAMASRTSTPFTTPRPANPRWISRPPRSSSSRWARPVRPSRSANAARPVRDVIAATGTVPGFGWRSYRAVDGAGPGTAVRADGFELANEHVRAVVDPADGTVTVSGDGMTVRGLNRYVDGGDGGDTYNYSPPAVDTVIDRPEAVAVTVSESGPVRARIVVTSTYALPASALGDERACIARAATNESTPTSSPPTSYAPVSASCVSTWSSTTGCGITGCAPTSRSRHRCPVPTPSARSRSCTVDSPPKAARTSSVSPRSSRVASSIVPRRVPALRWCTTGCSNTRSSPSTKMRVAGSSPSPCVRATGYLSRSEPALRPNPAGPLDRLDGPQLQTPLALDYAVALHRGDVYAADLPALADDVLVPLERVRGGGWPGASQPACGRALDVRGAEVSALTRDGEGALVLRVVNRTPTDTEVIVTRDGAPVVGQIVDLTGADLGEFRGTAALRRWELLTVRFSEG